MSKIQHVEIFEQKTPSDKWEIPLAFDMLFPEVDCVFGLNREPLTDFDYSVFLTHSSIVIDFGLENFMGYAKYSWLGVGETTPTNPGDANNITINVNNSDTCGTSSPLPTEQILKHLFTGSTTLKVGETTAKTIIIDYCLLQGTGVEAGKLTIINGEAIGIGPERFFNDNLLGVEYNVELTGNSINLIISGDPTKAFEFKYKLLTF